VTPGKIGLAYPHNDMKRLINAVGPARSKELIYTARHIGAAEALQIGLIDRLESADSLPGIVREFTALISANSGASARANKAIISAIEAGAASETPETRALFLETFSGSDFQIGYQAFLSKTKPEFSGGAS
jgi:enoyl-CoA hydratase/carnithine racemase